MEIIIIMAVVFIVVYFTSSYFNKKKTSKMNDDEIKKMKDKDRELTFRFMLLFIVLGIICVVLSQTLQIDGESYKDEKAGKMFMLLLGLFCSGIGAVGAIFTYKKKSDGND